MTGPMTLGEQQNVKTKMKKKFDFQDSYTETSTFSIVANIFKII